MPQPKGSIPWNKGKHHSEETKLKISLANQGKPCPWKGKKREGMSGENAPMFGKHHTDETREKLRTMKLGNKNCLGRKLSNETKKKISKARMGKCNPSRIGEKNNWWKGGITKLERMIRNSTEAKQWKQSIFEKNNFTCQICGIRGGYLHAHHIKRFANITQEFLSEYKQFSPIDDKYVLVRLATTYKPFWDIENGITYCKQCHKELHISNKGYINVN